MQRVSVLAALIVLLCLGVISIANIATCLTAEDTHLAPTARTGVVAALAQESVSMTDYASRVLRHGFASCIFSV